MILSRPTSRGLLLITSTFLVAGCNDVPFAIDPGVSAPQLVALDRWSDEVAVLHPRMSDSVFLGELLNECDPSDPATDEAEAPECIWSQFQIVVDGNPVPTRLAGDTAFGAPTPGGGARSVAVVVNGVRTELGQVQMRGIQSSCNYRFGNLPTVVDLDRIAVRARRNGSEWLDVVDLETCEAQPIVETYVGFHVGRSFRGPGHVVLETGEVWDVNRGTVAATVPCTYYEMNVEIAPGVCFGTENDRTQFFTPAGSRYYWFGGEGHADPVVSPDGFAIMINDQSRYVTDEGIPVFDTDSIRFYVEGQHVLGASFSQNLLHVVVGQNVSHISRVEEDSSQYYVRSYSLAGDLIQSAELSEPVFIKGAYFMDDAWIALAFTKPRIVEEGLYWFTTVRSYDLLLMRIDRQGKVLDRMTLDRIESSSTEWFGEVRLLPGRDPSVAFVQTWAPRIYKIDFGPQTLVH